MSGQPYLFSSRHPQAGAASPWMRVIALVSWCGSAVCLPPAQSSLAICWRSNRDFAFCWSPERCRFRFFSFFFLFSSVFSVGRRNGVASDFSVFFFFSVFFRFFCWSPERCRFRFFSFFFSVFFRFFCFHFFFFCSFFRVPIFSFFFPFLPFHKKKRETPFVRPLLRNPEIISDQGPLAGGGSNGGGFPDLGLSFLFCPLLSFWEFPDFSGIFPICPGMVRGFSRLVLFLFLETRPINSIYEEQSRKGPRHNPDFSRKKWETPRFWNPPV